MEFFRRKISTLAGIIILLIITSSLGAFIVKQVNEINDIKLKTLERALNE